MEKKTIEEFKEKLEKEKKQIEKQLKTFATKDKNVKGDWDTKFPNLNGASGEADLETSADEVEEYNSLLPIEYNLELRLQNINDALKKIKKRDYGICEKCKKQIPNERLRVYPEAKLCMKCK